MVLNNESIPSLDLYDWWLVIVFSTHITSAFKVGIEPHKAWMLGWAELVDSLVVLAVAVALATGQNSVIAGCCWRAFAKATCFALIMWESTALIPIVPSLKTLQHTEQLASLVSVVTALSHQEYFGSSNHFWLNLHFPISPNRRWRTRENSKPPV